MKQTLDPSIKLMEPVQFILENLMDTLKLKKLPKTVALHATCSMRKMGLEGKLEELARKCAETVVVPDGINCCGWAGDRGFTHPELNEAALKGLRMPGKHLRGGLFLQPHLPDRPLAARRHSLLFHCLSVDEASE